MVILDTKIPLLMCPQNTIEVSSFNVDNLISGTILQVICRGMAESLHEEHRHSRERPLSAALSPGVAHEKDVRKHMRRI